MPSRVDLGVSDELLYGRDLNLQRVWGRAACLAAFATMHFWYPSHPNLLRYSPYPPRGQIFLPSRASAALIRQVARACWLVRILISCRRSAGSGKFEVIIRPGVTSPVSRLCAEWIAITVDVLSFLACLESDGLCLVPVKVPPDQETAICHIMQLWKLELSGHSPHR